MKKRYQIDKQRAVQKFRQLAAQDDQPIQLVIPTGEEKLKVSNWSGKAKNDSLAGQCIDVDNCALQHFVSTRAGAS